MTSINVTSSYAVAAGQTLSFQDEIGFKLAQTADGPAPSLTVAGTVEVTIGEQSYVTGVISAVRITTGWPYVLTPGGAVTIETGGALKVVSNNPIAIARGFDGGIDDPDLFNHGAIDVSGRYAVTAVAAYAGPQWRFENTGVIKAVSTGDGAVGVFPSHGGLFHNAGDIQVQAHTSAWGVIIGNSVPGEGGSDATFVNDGSITAHGDGAGGGIAVYWGAEVVSGGGSFVNNGLLQGDYALKVLLTGGERQTYANTGQMIGKVETGDIAANLINSGTIQGAVTFGASNDVYDGRSGVLVGELSAGAGADTLSGGAGSETLFGGAGDDSISGGDGYNYLRGDDGADVIQGGAGFDDINGNVGADTLHGGRGEDWVVGGKDDDQLYGDEAFDVVYGNLGNDTVDGGAGADWVRGGQGDDLVLGGDGDDWLWGDRGSDTLTGGAGADLFHTLTASGQDRVTDFNGAEGDRVIIDTAGGYTVSQIGADTVIDLGGGDQLVLVGVSKASLQTGWILQL